mmetsp:Transcript_12346/g.35012  ORF Transcript_12346/g.35012 Transcript_12346/m.35012 type:complete len:248 (-) Transcript_12346:595-1338(-)
MGEEVLGEPSGRQFKCRERGRLAPQPGAPLGRGPGQGRRPDPAVHGRAGLREQGPALQGVLLLRPGHDGAAAQGRLVRGDAEAAGAALRPGPHARIARASGEPLGPRRSGRLRPLPAPLPDQGQRGHAAGRPAGPPAPGLRAAAAARGRARGAPGAAPRPQRGSLRVLERVSVVLAAVWDRGHATAGRGLVRDDEQLHKAEVAHVGPYHCMPCSHEQGSAVLEPVEPGGREDWRRDKQGREELRLCV